MKITFNQQSLEELYNIPISDFGKQQFSKSVIKNYQSRIRILKYANDLGDIAKLSGMKLEKLNSKKHGKCQSIRVNDQFRIIFKEIGKGEIEILILELSKHYE